MGTKVLRCVRSDGLGSEIIAMDGRPRSSGVDLAHENVTYCLADGTPLQKTDPMHFACDRFTYTVTSL